MSYANVASFIAVLVISFLLSACSNITNAANALIGNDQAGQGSATPTKTSSPKKNYNKRPEMVLPASRKVSVLNAISNKMLDENYTLEENGNTRLVYERPLAKGFGRQILRAMTVGGEHARLRVVLNIVPFGEGQTRYVVQTFEVTPRSDDKGEKTRVRTVHYREWHEFFDSLLAG